MSFEKGRLDFIPILYIYSLSSETLCQRMVGGALVLFQLLLEYIPLHGKFVVLELGVLEVALQHVVLPLQEGSPEVESQISIDTKC